MDESGDLGFKKGLPGSSRFFIITFLLVQEKRPFEKIIQKIHRELREHYRVRTGVLHAAHEKPETILRILSKLSEKEGCAILAMVVDKQRVPSKMKYKKHVLYNHITHVLLNRIIDKQFVAPGARLYFIASQRETNRYLNENFKAYISGNLQRKHAIQLDIQIRTPFQEKCLQLVDSVSWAIARKYEKSDERYYSVIKNLTIEEDFILTQE